MTNIDCNLKDRIILITGASRGIGRACAIVAAQAGAQVLAVARTEGALHALDDEIQAMGLPAISSIQADLSKPNTIHQLMNAIAGRFGRIDALVANAGVLGALSPITHCEASDLMQTMSLNFMANFELIKYGDPLLRQSDNGRAVFISSGVATNPRAYWGPYAISKAAMENLVLTYSREILQTNIKVNVINPGAVRTQMRAKAFPGEDPLLLPEPITIAQKIMQYCSADCQLNGQVINAQ